jgi:hypothetical protein
MEHFFDCYDEDTYSGIDEMTRKLTLYDSKKEAMKDHGILMLVGWGVLLPAAVACSVLLRHRDKHPRYPFFHLHVLFATLGTAFTIAGWVIGMRNLTTIEDGVEGDGWWSGQNKGYAHAGAFLLIQCCNYEDHSTY